MDSDYLYPFNPDSDNLRIRSGLSVSVYSTPTFYPKLISLYSSLHRSLIELLSTKNDNLEEKNKESFECFNFKHSESLEDLNFTLRTDTKFHMYIKHSMEQVIDFDFIIHFVALFRWAGIGSIS